MAQKKTDRQATVRAIGKGFYIALALCVIAVGGMAVSTFTDTMQAGEEQSAFTTAPPTTATSASPAAVTPATATTTATASTLTTTTTVITTTSAPAARFCLPLDGTVGTPFSETPLYNETMEDYRAHPGTDMDGEEGDTVLALAAGTVTAWEEDALWGGSLTIAHGNGLTSVYRGVDATVQNGDAVQTGDPIGILVGVPCESADGCHLHLELYRDGKAIDPMSLADIV